MVGGSLPVVFRMVLLLMPKRKVTKNQLEDFWFENYRTQHCTICGNRGVIDSRGVTTSAGVSVGRRNWCICPNGQVFARRHKGLSAEEVLS